ncbi:MAG: DUF1273 family protein [Oscillospiraceae bacterium]|nr:DUF1273 family protein [Oscillospiraceae bacterium]
MNRENTCCFTGYRPDKLPWGVNEEDERCLILKEKLADVAAALYESGVRRFICGMALGCDTYFCEAALALREEHDDVTVEAAIPCLGQAERWPKADRERYYRLSSRCDVETLIGREYTPDCMAKRNRYMIEQSSVLVAVYDGRWGGTMQTVNLARKQGLEIIEVMP